MEVYYKVKLDKKINDIEKIDKPNISHIYLLTETKGNYKYHSKLKNLNEDNEILTFALDCNNIVKEKDKIFRKIKNINKKSLKNFFQVIVFNYNKNDKIHIFDLIKSIKVMLLPTKLEKYDYIYDTVCDYLDNEFVCKNICDFKDDKCIAKRDFNCTCGCCRHFKSLFSNKIVQCKYLINKRCSTKCLTCKMFTCSYIVKNKKIKFRIRDIFLLHKFFNPIQKIIILTSYFTPKEKILNRLLMCG